MYKDFDIQLGERKKRKKKKGHFAVHTFVIY